MAANDNEKVFMDTFMPAMQAHTGLKDYKAFFAYEQRLDAAHRMAKQAQDSGERAKQKRKAKAKTRISKV